MFEALSIIVYGFYFVVVWDVEDKTSLQLSIGVYN